MQTKVLTNISLLLIGLKINHLLFIRVLSLTVTVPVDLTRLMTPQMVILMTQPMQKPSKKGKRRKNTVLRPSVIATAFTRLIRTPRPIEKRVSENKIA